MANTVGVLPLPPTLIFPTTITGTSSLYEAFKLMLYNTRRIVLKHQNNPLNGAKR